MIEAGLFSHLAANAAVSALVANADNTKRIYPHRAPQGATFPRVTYFRVDSQHKHHMTAAAGHVEARLQIDCWALTYAAAKSLADAVRVALDGYRGTWSPESVRSCLLIDQRDQHEAPAQADDGGIYRVSMDFRVAFTETVPTFA